MKKYFFMTIAAIASIALVGCQGPDQNNPEGPGTTPTTPDAKVVISPKTLEIAVDEQGKLRSALNPSKEGVVISYKSDDEAVATVDASGLVTGIAGGTANIIASAEGYQSDTCVVTVVDASEVFAWGGLGLFGDQTEKVGEEYQHWDKEDQCYYKAQNFIGTFYVWSSDIFFVNGSGFSGAGYFAEVQAPVAIIQEGDWKGYYYMPTLLFTDTIEATAEGACEPGALTDANAWGTWLTDSTYEGDNSLKGTTLDYLDFDAQKSLPCVGFIKDGILVGNSSAAYYRMNITWFNINEGLYGLKMESNEEGKFIAFVKPFEFTSRSDKYYELLPESSGNHKIAPMKINNPEQVRMLKNLSKTRLHVAK